MKKEYKIAILGIGGVGGYIGVKVASVPNHTEELNLFSHFIINLIILCNY